MLFFTASDWLACPGRRSPGSKVNLGRRRGWREGGRGDLSSAVDKWKWWIHTQVGCFGPYVCLKLMFVHTSLFHWCFQQCSEIKGSILALTWLDMPGLLSLAFSLSDKFGCKPALICSHWLLFNFPARPGKNTILDKRGLDTASILLMMIHLTKWLHLLPRRWMQSHTCPLVIISSCCALDQMTWLLVWQPVCDTLFIRRQLTRATKVSTDWLCHHSNKWRLHPPSHANWNSVYRSKYISNGTSPHLTPIYAPWPWDPLTPTLPILARNKRKKLWERTTDGGIPLSGWSHKHELKNTIPTLVHNGSSIVAWGCPPTPQLAVRAKNK